MLKPQFENVNELYEVYGYTVWGGTLCKIVTTYEEAKKIVLEELEEAIKDEDNETRITTKSDDEHCELWSADKRVPLDEDDDPEDYPDYEEWKSIWDCDWDHEVFFTITRLI